ncbi:MAG: 2-dehydropantoate 2-reductase [Elusimicrobia bacterium]|nr:2-dehydropantoate 2-reductase [Elusimicrobiota bacterium]
MLIVGPGSIGRLLAGLWARSGLRVRLLARTAKQEDALTRHGLRYTGPAGERRIIRGLAAARRGPRPSPSAAAFFCVKAADLSAAIRAARPWLGPDAPAVALQNGIGHARAFRRAFGRGRSVIGSCYAAAHARGDGAVEHAGGRDIHLASDADNAGAAALAAALLRRGGWRVRVVGDESRMLWTKLVTNAAVNFLGAASAAPNGELARDPALRLVLDALVREGVMVAKAAGHPPIGRPGEAVPRGCRAAGSQLNSMLVDLRRGRRTEVRAIAGPILAEARRRRVPAPTIATLARVVERLERAALSRRRRSS